MSFLKEKVTCEAKERRVDDDIVCLLDSLKIERLQFMRERI